MKKFMYTYRIKNIKKNGTITYKDIKAVDDNEFWRKLDSLNLDKETARQWQPAGADEGRHW